jgi:epoxide hydrolase-like predicted phosphatase
MIEISAYFYINSSYTPSDILISMTIKAIIFDLGGVLLRTIDSTPRDQLAARLKMTRYELEELIFGGESGERAQRGEITIQEHWETLRQGLHYSPSEFKELLDQFFARDEIDGQLVETIRKLHQTYKTALLSNAWNDLRQTLHERWNLDGLFDELIISAEVKMVKPDPRIYHLALDRLGVTPSEAVFIDDMADNVEAARKEGLRAIWYQDTQQTMDSLNGYLSTE